MKSLGADDHLDEVHCLWALCPHPCCWESERRIAEGVYRRAVRAQSIRRSTAEEGSPCLSLVDVSEWSALSSGRTSLSRSPPPRRDAAPRLKTTDPSFPAITTAAAKWHTGESGARNKADNTAHISPPIGSPLGSGSLLLWVPNPRYVPQCFKSSKSLLCSVKELICLPAAPTPNTFQSTPQKTTKSVRFQLSCSPQTFRPCQWAESVSPGQLEAGTGDDLNASAAANDPKDLRDPSGFPVRNKPAVLHSVREKRVGRASQDTPASLYKLDSKTGEEEVDWDSLRGQPYLWKRHSIPPEHAGPPGGARDAQETASSSSVSKPSWYRTLRSPKGAAPAAWPCHPLMSHKKHPQGTGSELDMIICSTSAMLDTDERRERHRGSKGTFAPLNSEFYGRRSTHEIYGNNPSTDSSQDLRIITGAMEPWGGRRSSEHLCTSIPSLS